MLVCETDQSLRDNELGAAFADVWYAIPLVEWLPPDRFLAARRWSLRRPSTSKRRRVRSTVANCSKRATTNARRRTGL
jgi:hypothetical protein